MVAQAGPLGLIGNGLDGTLTVIDTAVSVTNTASPTNVTVRATVTLTSTPVAGIVTSPTRAEAYVAGLTQEGASVLTVVGTSPPVSQITEMALSAFEPIGVAVNPAGTRAYVTGGLFDNTVSVVNLDTRLEIATITLHPTDAVGPYGLVVHPSQPRLYVANSNSGTISVINTATNAIVTTITLTPCPNGCAPNRMVMSPDGGRLYVTDDFADVVWVINTTNNTIVTSVSGVLFPEGIAVHPDGSRLYVANVDDSGAGLVTEIATASNTVTLSAAVGLNPIGIAVDRGGNNVLIVNYGDDTVTVASTADLTNQVVLPVGGAPATFGEFITAAVTGSIQFSSANYSVNEPLTGTVTATITVTRTGAAGATILVPYSTSAGTATPGADYIETSGTLTFGAGITSRTFLVTIQSDNVGESPETVNLTLGPPIGLTNLGEPNVAVLTITDISGGTIQFSQASYSGSEAAGSIPIVVTRTGAKTTIPATVDVTTSNLAPVEAQGGNVGDPGIDYAATTTTLTFAAGVSSLTFPLPIANDTLAEGNERFRITLSNPSPGARLGNPSTAIVTILDDEVVLQFAAGPFVVSEDGSKATITVERSGPPGGTVTVQYATSNGTATGGPAAGPGVDYINASGTLTFGPTATQQTFTVTILNDFVIEPDETVTLTLSNPVAVGTAATPILGPRNPATLTITNDDKAGTIEFSAATYTGSETAGAATIVVSRTGGVAEGVTVAFTTSAGTATAGDDYTETTTVLTFAGGETSKTVTIPIINDGAVESNETVNLTLSSPGGGGTLGPRSTAVLTIVSDDQPGVVEFSAATYSVNEAAGPARIVVNRTGGNASNVTVNYATSDGTAVAPGDYGATTGTLTFGAGVSSLTFTVPIVNDTEGEGPETVNLTLSNPGGGATLGAKKTAVLTILDDKQAVQFAGPEFLGLEGSAGGVITVTRTGPPGLPGTVTVQYRASDDTAVALRDYTATSGTLTFPPGVASKTFTVPITNGSILEVDEFVTLTLLNPSVAVLGSQKTAKLRIRDDDPGTLKLSAATYSVPEKNTGQKVVVTVQRTGSLNATTTVLFQTLDGTATGGAAPGPGVDYISVSQILTFLPTETKKDVIITIVDDNLAEGNETFRVRLGGRDVNGLVTDVVNATVNPIVGGEATVTIVDDDKAGTVQFEKATFTATEPASGTLLVEISVTRSGGNAGPATVAYSTADGSATAGEDYTATSGVLTFGFNEVKKTFNVPVLADSVIEGTETVRLTLSNPTGGLTVGPQSSAVLSILEGLSVVQFSQLVFTTPESTPMATITVVRSGSLTDVATVRFRTVDGTATAPADYGNRSGVLTFAKGSTTQTFTIPIVNDDLVEGDQTVNLVLSDPVGAVLGQLSTSTLVITDNDLPGTIAFGNASFTVSESGGVAKITVTRTGGTATGITVQYTTEDITATGGPATGPGVDYMTTSGTITFLAKETSKTFDVRILNDDVAEVPETVRLKLSNPGGGATLGLAEAILTITNDDKPGAIQFSAPIYSATEGAVGVTSTATIVVTRTGGTAPGVTVAYQTNNGTATSGADYGATSGVLSFGAGVTSLTFTIPVFGDGEADGDETLTVSLSNPTAGATLGTPSTATVNIFDDEQVIQFSSLTYSVGEAGPAAEITIVRSGSTAAAASVRFKTGGPGDTATAGSGSVGDYTAQDITVNFPAKSAVQKVRVPITNDTQVEGNETVTLTLDTPSSGAVIGPRGTATLTILDNDAPGVIRFDKPVFPATEPATGSVVVPITISRTGTGLGGGVTVDLTIMDGTATGGGVDYSLPSQTTTMSFAAGEAKKTVNITVFADTLLEDNETVLLKLTNPTLGATLAPPTGAPAGVTSPDAVLAIASDDKPGVFQFASATFTVTEPVGVSLAATITVNRAGTAATLASDVTVDFTVTGGTALRGTDWTFSSPTAGGGRLRFGAGVTSQTFTVIILPDTSAEGPETIVLGLQNPSSGATLGTPSTATVNINDVQTGVSFTAPILSTPESGTAQVTIVRTGPVAGITSTVRFTAVTGAFVTPGVDFTPVSDVLVTFPPGSTKQTVTVSILPDTLPELNESIALVLTNPTNAVIGPAPVAFLFITDDDPGTFRFTSPIFTVKEGEPVAVIGVTRVGTPTELAQPATATVTFDDGTAVNGRDYTAPPNRSQVLTFAPNITTQTFVVPIIDNEIKDGARSFLMGILATAPAVTSASTRATVTIQDND